MIDHRVLSETLTACRAAARRDFIRNTLCAAVVPTLGALVAAAADAKSKPRAAAEPAVITKKFKVGVIGLGGRGNWVAKFFKQHGGFEIHAGCDYFQEEADKFGGTYGIPKERLFAGLGGYKKLIESGVDIVAAETVPYFLPEIVTAAVAAAKHVYMAKPVAVDVPGCLAVRAAARDASARKQMFMVDFQAPTDPLLIELRQGIRDGGLGQIAYVCTYGVVGQQCAEPAREMPKPERLRKQLWAFDRVLGADVCAQFDVHAIDLAVWVLGKTPIEAMGFAAIKRPNPVLDGVDVLQTVARFDDGVIWTHQHQSLKNNSDLTGGGGLVCKIMGNATSAVLPYVGKAFIRGGEKHRVGTVENTYAAGVERNVAQYYKNLIEGRFESETAPRAVDTQLTAILFREAGRRGARLTMSELLKENKKLDYDLSGFDV
ncbi:MAG: Gfo/Idh/MocA family oxidoreductase [Opitutaceae bacterium]|nr:Gfo/Idh/MocA family oxidoreductase [Opitutaceae bacterium]